MKKINNRSLLAFFSVILAFGILSSCKEEIQLKSLPNLFRPINFNVTLNKTIATIAWAPVDSAVSYTLQISTDSLYGTMLVDTTTTQLSYIKELAGETTFYAHIRANAKDNSITKSSFYNRKFANGDLSFKTPKENLFLGFGISNNTGNTYSAFMTDINTLDVKWTPGANVTNLVLTSATGSSNVTVPISAAEAKAGEKIVPSLSNSNWKVQIYNNTILRGTTYGLIEGDIVITAGGDISTAITNAAAGQVILLAGGNNYTIGNAEYKFTKNVKIRSASPVNRSVVSLTTLTGTTPPSSTSNMISVVASAALDSLVFENIDFTGFCDNNTASTKIGYLFSNKVACNVNTIKFTNCNIHNFGNTSFRLSGGVSQRVSNLYFRGCIINEIGYSSVYAIVNSNSADYVDNITFSYCTVYNIKGSLILRTGAYTMGSINISNCTFNQGMQDTGSARYFIDANTMTITSGINIKNSIFGSSGGTVGANGVRVTTGTKTITGCYFTTDYIDDPIPAGTTSSSIKSYMTSYSGPSTTLWIDPVNGNFKLKDSAFKGKGVAGDLRWY
jgi:hypothetical protein